MRDGRSHGDVGEEVVGEAGGLSKESKQEGFPKGEGCECECEWSSLLVLPVRERDGVAGGVGAGLGLSPDRMLSAFIAGPYPQSLRPIYGGSYTTMLLWT